MRLRPAMTVGGADGLRLRAAMTAFNVIPGLYGCLPDSKKNLCCVAKKSAAFLYPALIAWFVWFPGLARWPRCIFADRLLISIADC